MTRFCTCRPDCPRLIVTYGRGRQFHPLCAMQRAYATKKAKRLMQPVESPYYSIDERYRMALKRARWEARQG